MMRSTHSGENAIGNMRLPSISTISAGQAIARVAAAFDFSLTTTRTL